MTESLGCEQRIQIVDQFLKDFPTHPTRELSRAIYAKYGNLWPTQVACYNSVRYARGEMVSGAGHYRKNPIKRDDGIPDTMPKSKATAWEPVVIPNAHAARTLILTDIHVPYHDPEALEAALRHGDKFNPTLVLLDGDIVDFYTISRYETRPSERDLKTEILFTRQLFKHLRKRYPKARITYKLGNHDERWMHNIWKKAPELANIKEFDIDQILHTTEYGMDVVDDQRMIMLGKLPVLHGHELPKGMSSPVNPARGFFMRGIEIMLAGHLHRTSEHTEPTMLGKTITCWSTGCLCDLHPEYARINKWNSGFATVEVSKDGSFNCDNLRIHKGKVL